MQTSSTNTLKKGYKMRIVIVLNQEEKEEAYREFIEDKFGMYGFRLIESYPSLGEFIYIDEGEQDDTASSN